ncbi:hypothetical protein RQP46_008480 [Phenoliferia psychrophenolica]
MSSVFNSSRLAGKTVLITGGSSGIGAATAVLFARAGANIIITARRQAQLDVVAEEAKKANKEGGSGKGGEVTTLLLDIQDPKAVSSILDKLPNVKVDILVNNAGMVLGKEQVGDISESDVVTMFNTNVIGLISLTQIFVREFKKQHSGHIIFLGSIAGKEPYAGGAIYTATKFAVHAFQGSMARELVNTPIRVTQICPGMVETEFSIVRFRGDKDAADKVYENVQPLVANDIAEEIVWAASRPDHVNIADVLIFPKCQASAGIVHRGPLQMSSSVVFGSHGHGHIGHGGHSKEARIPLAPSVAPHHPPPTKHALVLVRESPTSSDPFDSVPAPLPSSNFTALLLGQLQKPRYSLPGTHNENVLALSSSSSPQGPFAGPKACKSSSSGGSAAQTGGRRSVKFSSSPLESLHSSPRHAGANLFFPSHSSKAVYSSAPRQPLFPLAHPHPNPLALAALDRPVTSSPTRRVASPALPLAAPLPVASSPLSLEDLDPDESEDEDQADEAVFSLLLGSPSPSQSPTRPQPLKLAPSPACAPAIFTPLGSTFPPSVHHPHSILKRSRHPILKAPNATEGSRRNGGRRKHALGWSDADAAAAGAGVGLGMLAAKGTASTSNNAGGASRATGDPVKRARRAGENSVASTSGPAGGAGGRQAAGQDGGDEPPEGSRPPSSGPLGPSASRQMQYPRDDDPIVLRVPLLTLRESLRSFAAPNQSPSGALASSSPVPPSGLPTGLLPRSTSNDRSSPLHQSMRGTQPSAIARTTDSAPNADAPPPMPVLLCEIESAYAHLVRALIRLPTPLADAERTLAPLTEYRSSLLRSLDRDISNIVSFPTPSPFNPPRGRGGLLSENGSSSGSDSGSSSPLAEGTRGTRRGLSDEEMRRQKDEVAVAQVAIKVVSALARDPRLFKLFSDGELNELIGKILAIPGANNLAPSVPKDMYPFVTFFISTQRLPHNLIAPHIFRISIVLRTTFSTLDKPRNNLAESISAVTHLVQSHPDAFLSYWRNWFRPTVEGLWEGPKKSTAVKHKAVKALGEVVKAATMPREGENDEARSQREVIANLLAEELKARSDDRTALTHLASQLDAALKTDEAIWAVHVIALLPALLGKLFRKLEPKGVRPWIELVNKCRENASEDVKTLSTLLWNHLAFAFMKTTLEDGSVWVFRADGKPFQLLIQLFGPTLDGWGEVGHKSPKDYAYALTLAGTMFGLSVLNLQLPAAPPLSPDDVQVANLDQVWDKVAAIALQGAMASRDAAIASVGWAILAAIVKAPSTAPDAPSPTLNSLINPIFLNGAPPKGKVVAPGSLAKLGLEKACRPEAIPGWTTRWTVTRAAKVLGVVENALGLVGLPVGTVVTGFEPNVFVFWSHFMTALSTAGDTEALVTVLQWLTRICPAAPSLVVRLAGTTLSTLADHVDQLCSQSENAEILLLSDDATAILTKAFADHFVPPSTPGEDIRIMSHLIACVESPASEGAQERLFALSRVALISAFTADSHSNIASAARMLASSPDALFGPLCIDLLGHLKTTVSPSQAMLDLLAPLLGPTLERALQLRSDSQPPTKPDWLLVLASVTDFWGATFHMSSQPLDIDEGLMNSISLIRDVTEGLVNCAETQGETQSQWPSSNDQPPSSVAPPPAAQAAPSRIPDSTMDSAFDNTANQSGLGYDADTSHAPQPSDEYSILGAHRFSGSPSLRLPTASDPEELAVATALVEETPPEIQHTRSRSSLASMASGASLASAAPSAPATISQASSRESRASRRKRGTTSSLEPIAKKAKTGLVSPDASVASANRSSRRLVPFVEIRVPASGKRALPSGSGSASPSPKRVRTLPAPAGDVDTPGSRLGSATGDLTDASASEAEPADDQAISAAATEAVQHFLTQTIGVPRHLILKAANSFMGPDAVNHFLRLGEEAHEQFPPLSEVVPESTL